MPKSPQGLLCQYETLASARLSGRELEICTPFAGQTVYAMPYVNGYAVA